MTSVVLLPLQQQICICDKLASRPASMQNNKQPVWFVFHCLCRPLSTRNRCRVYPVTGKQSNEHRSIPRAEFESTNLVLELFYTKARSVTLRCNILRMTIHTYCITITGSNLVRVLDVYSPFCVVLLLLMPTQRLLLHVWEIDYLLIYSELVQLILSKYNFSSFNLLFHYTIIILTNKENCLDDWTGRKHPPTHMQELKVACAQGQTDIQWISG